MAEHSSVSWRPTIGRRVAVAAAMLAVWALVIASRLVYLQVVKYDELWEDAQKQQTRHVRVAARRGDILDRNGNVLARSVKVPSIYAEPGKAEGRATKAIGAICAALGGDPPDCEPLPSRLSAPGGQVPVKRFAALDQARSVNDLKLPWIRIEWERQRFYPNREVGAAVLGAFGKDGKPHGGVEQSQDKRLRGRDGKLLLLVDANVEPYDSRVETPPEDGARLVLTLDLRMQRMVERELARGVRENRATSGMAVVTDPSTGHILAMAAYPTFNPNSPTGSVRNPVVEDALEVGSVMKIFTAAAVLEAGVVKPEDVIDLSGGKIALDAKGRDVVRDTHVYAKLPFTDVIAKSSNVGTIKAAKKLGLEKLPGFLRRFGFDGPVSVDFPAESAGILQNASSLKEAELARVAIGYNVGVTPLQLAAAVSAIANGGELLQQQVVQAYIRDGVRYTQPRTVLGRSVSPGVSAQVTRVLEQVVMTGTGRDAQVPGYSVAGKTGTAQKLLGQKYSDTEHGATFVGFVPSRSPAFTIVVVIDSPHRRDGNNFGGPVAGPIFARIAEEALRMAGVPPNVNPPAPLLVRRDQEGVRERPTSGPTSPPAALTAIDHRPGADGRLPDVTGMSLREAIGTLTRLGVIVHTLGSGLVVDQRPLPGTPFEAGTAATVWFGRRAPVPQTANPGRP